MNYPLRHISIRVPWHDAGWNGSVCRSPKRNTACLKLINIAESKKEEAEEAVKGKLLSQMKPDDLPPCVKERGTFMADFAFDRYPEHPYANAWNNTHSHFKRTRLHHPPYAAAALPFRWMMKPVVFGDEKEEERGLIKDFPLQDVNLGFEPKLGFDTRWVQDHRNHRALLECFWNHVRVEESLVFFYAKQVPLTEDTGRRVLVGVGRVKMLGGLTEYEYEGSPEGKIRSLLWERMVTHSIRPDFKDGFLLPYHEALEKCNEGAAFDPAEVVAFAPEDRFMEFSFATEHVGNDAAISALLECRSALLRASKLFNVATRLQEQWIDRELGRLWKKRGPFPGLGSILAATGVPMGHFMAQALVEKVAEDGNPWEAWNKVLADPKQELAADLACHIDSTTAQSWLRMPKERRAFLELLSRFDLTEEQANFVAIQETRQEAGIPGKDESFIENPYLVYEATRLTATPVSIGAVDRGMFPAHYIRTQHPIPEPSLVKTAVDARRLRALVIRELEQAGERGHTLRSQAEVIQALRQHDDDSGEQETKVTGDHLRVAEEGFPSGILKIAMADGSPAYQLERFGNTGALIRRTVDDRVQAKRHALSVNWRTELDARLPPMPSKPTEREREERARSEKAAALAEIAASRFSVLVGPAGTGKTTLLSVLCQRPEIHGAKILLLAPTGKARVRMEELARASGTQNFQASTLAQFLGLSDPPRYDFSTRRYRLTGKAGSKVASTVIVDECSMLTEEMMAALLEALSGVQRLIFVGDPRQLPPIGAGRPFTDIIARLQPEDIELRSPRIAAGYAELTVPMRQGAGERADLQLASWFGGSVGGPGEDQVFEILSGRRKSEIVRFVPWSTPDELEQVIPKVLAETLGFEPNLEEWQAFAKSLGGVLDDRGSVWFNTKYGDRDGSGRCAEHWQILSPVRQKPWGVEGLNRLIHARYKGPQIEKARNPGKYRSIPPPMGDEQIIYGDKVINNRNRPIAKGRIFPKPAGTGYLANGELGMVVGHRRTKKRDWKPEALEVEFSTQEGSRFSFYSSQFDDNQEANLELAYALTIHKAQGSEFGVVFLVLPRSPLMLTRELLYTSLTRQKQKVVIFHQGSATDLQKLSSEHYSSTASRLTNLFVPPKPVALGKLFLEERLIHLTSRGEAVRSKSEVIIANELFHRKLDYHYEQPLELGGVVKYPDFTIEDANRGITFYWEHCGLLHEPAYLRRWEEKQAWYRKNGILPREEGQGENGTLLITVDKPDGGIDSHQIAALIKDVFGA